MHRERTTLFQVMFPMEGSGSAWIVAAGALLLVIAIWVSPASPVALRRADALMGSGRSAAAARTYDSIGRFHPMASVRYEAKYRSAMLHKTHLGDLDGARDRLSQVASGAAVELASVAWERLADLQRIDRRRSREAAQSYYQAWSVAPDAEEAADRLEAAARAWQDAGEYLLARDLWGQIASTYPGRRGAALLGRAELMLSVGRIGEARVAFEESVRVSQEDGVVSIARLGVATCLERQGDLDDALAAIDAIDLPVDILEARRSGIRARQEEISRAL